MSIARTARLLEATKPEPFSAKLGEQLVEALRERRMGEGDTLASFPSYAVGYLEGLLSNIAVRVPEAREMIQWHVAAQRRHVTGAAE